MKRIFVFAAITFCAHAAKGQSTSDILKQQAGQGVKEGAKTVTENAGDKVTGRLLNELFGKKKKKNNDNTEGSASPDKSISVKDTTGTGSNAGASGGGVSLQTYSKFDFIPGDKILAFDDYSKDAIGDFPASWNTNSTGEVVTSSARPGHWLMLAKPGKFIPGYFKSIPDNFTMEFDLSCNKDYNYYSPPLIVYFLTGSNSDKDIFDNWFLAVGKRDGVKFSIQPTGGVKTGYATIENFEDGKSIMKNQVPITQFNNREGRGDQYVHISIWRQKQRIRVYLNEDKVYDIPRAFAETGKPYSTLFFEIFGGFKNQDRYLLNNIKFATGAPDTRNKLMTEGKFSTTGILFDVNSAAIKPQSFGVLKDIASVLQDNSSVRVKIVGYTDSDGDAAANMTLSKKRAGSVKDVLIKNFAIDASRLETDGKGATQPVASNSTSEGKAQNRRVEFIKQ
ncbi:MAG: hypothetical protein B6D37_07365 [Sphingobacteriales bacterium UTBCD1]|jgi:outer membrane protein OmpA-like peptidoglycan-associated protein|nr:MAG: hypothetical protein B6D37_07365 [Sphingobacteriales bacterium UTBCD1]